MTTKPKRVALCAHVSTDGQSTDHQPPLAVAEYVDHGVSGAKGRKDRAQFDALLHGVTRRDFEIVATWSVDRLGRSL